MSNIHTSLPELHERGLAHDWNESPDLVRGMVRYQFPRNSSSPGYEAFRVVKSGEGVLYGFTVYNSGSAQFVQVFDASALPADNAVPVLTLAAGAAANLGAYYGSTGRWFYQGIVICNSSTGPTKTVGGADCFFDAQYA